LYAHEKTVTIIDVALFKKRGFNMSNFEHSVLIIDSDLLNITALTYLLSDEFNVFTERSGCKSIEVAKEVRPDIILLDVVMPDMNGFEVITALKKDEATKDIPVIFVTGLNNTRDEEQGLTLGAVDYVNKPFSSYILKLRIKNQLQIQKYITHDLSTDTGINEKRESILIIDDDKLNIIALTRILGADYQVYFESGGENGIKVAKTLKPDLILLDVLMPEITGLEVIKFLKTDEETRDIPVIFLTGRRDVQDEEAGFVLGAVDYITKPFSASVVKIRVRNQLKIVT